MPSILISVKQKDCRSCIRTIISIAYYVTGARRRRREGLPQALIRTAPNPSGRAGVPAYGLSPGAFLRRTASPPGQPPGSGGEGKQGQRRSGLEIGREADRRARRTG